MSEEKPRSVGVVRRYTPHNGYYYVRIKKRDESKFKIGDTVLIEMLYPGISKEESKEEKTQASTKSKEKTNPRLKFLFNK